MQQLVEGVHYFNNIGRTQHLQLFEKLKHRQEPEACFITCADSRIVPTLITQADPGELFIVRNVGNLVPCYGTTNNGEMAAVEYAIVELGIEDIVICGHTGCGAMKAVVSPDEPGTRSKLPSVREWLRHADATAEIMRTHYQHLSGEALYHAAAEENVLVQLEHLRTLPVIAARACSGQVRLHAWMFQIDTGEVYRYDSEAGQFERFGSDPGGPAPARRQRTNIRENGGRRIRRKSS